MQFYMNPNSILTASYFPYALTLMTGLTPAPKENQMGELNLIVDETLTVGSDLTKFNSFNKFQKKELSKTTPKTLTSGTYDNSSFTSADLSEIKKLKDKIDDLKKQLAATANTSLFSEITSLITSFKSEISLIFSTSPSTVIATNQTAIATNQTAIAANPTALCKFVEDTIKKQPNIDQIFKNATELQECINKNGLSKAFDSKCKSFDKKEFILTKQMLDKLIPTTTDLNILIQILCKQQNIDSPLLKYIKDIHLILTGKIPEYSKSGLCDELQHMTTFDSLNSLEKTKFILPDAKIDANNFDSIKEGDVVKDAARTEYTIKVANNGGLITTNHVVLALSNKDIKENNKIKFIDDFSFVKSGNISYANIKKLVTFKIYTNDSEAQKQCIETYNMVIDKISHVIDENHNQTKTGGGLKHKREIQSTVPRIYRPVIQRKIDYYNYA